MTIALPLTVAAGVDAGQRFLDVALAPSGQTFRMPNLAEGIAEIIARLERSGVRRVVLEAIGPYAEPLIKALSVAGFEVGIVNPRRIKAFREAEGGRAKTDRLDARLIARFALTMPETLRPLPTDTQLELKALSLRRRQLTEMIAMEKTRMKQVCGTLLLDSHRAAIAALSAQCQAIEAELARRIGDDAELRRVLHILKSIPGIGERVATLLITDLPELGQRDRKAIASLAGLAPTSANPAQRRLAPPSPADVPAFAPRSTWPPWSPPATTPSSATTTTPFACKENPERSRSSQSHENCSSQPTHSSKPTRHIKVRPLTHKTVAGFAR
uniref:Transposase IS116/IS110/IS902 family protein n=2 Tax=Rhodopseudomonas TaxID=1073 RepID=E6VGY0_RHOPX|nr:IS110 family transposase [Rhodopseudomonas palustris]